jgi:hypothetical protein
MDDNTIEIFADSLSDARRKASALLTPGFRISNEVVFNSGDPITKLCHGKTFQEALAGDRKQIPENGKIISEKQVQAASYRKEEVNAHNQDEALSKVKAKILTGENIDKVDLLIEGKMKFLMFSKPENTYLITFQKPFIAEITYTIPVLIRVTLHQVLAGEELLAEIMKLREEATLDANGFEIVSFLPGVKTPIGGANLSLGVASTKFNTLLEDVRISFPEKTSLKSLNFLSFGAGKGSGLNIILRLTLNIQLISPYK